jgi:hypothetical protein
LLGALAVPAIGVAVLIGLDVARWGPYLRAATLDYLTHPLAYEWYALPLAEQTPMSAWNRTAMQALVNAGMPAAAAQAVAGALWLLLLGATVVVLWRRGGPAPRASIPFPLAFAVAFVLLYWARPVGWTFVYLELVLIGAVWPWLRRWERAALLLWLVALMASHWLALIRTAAGQDMAFLTLQTARAPWESWLVLPVCWLVLLLALAHSLERSADTGS